MEVSFVDKVCLASLLRLISLGDPGRTVWHFEAMDSSARRWIKLLRRLGKVRCEFRQIEHYVGQVKDEAGNSEYVDLLNEARTISSTIRKDELIGNPLIRAMGAEWSIKKVLWFFEKRIEEKLQREKRI